VEIQKKFGSRQARGLSKNISPNSQPKHRDNPGVVKQRIRQDYTQVDRQWRMVKTPGKAGKLAILLKCVSTLLVRHYRTPPSRSNFWNSTWPYPWSWCWSVRPGSMKFLDERQI